MSKPIKTESRLKRFYPDRDTIDDEWHSGTIWVQDDYPGEDGVEVYFTHQRWKSDDVREGIFSLTTESAQLLIKQLEEALKEPDKGSPTWCALCGFYHTEDPELHKAKHTCGRCGCTAKDISG